ncbi:MAG: hypothetical protein VX528_12240, partial [Candidatus Latescibacterota bacterium]|nr:hypothetical protein [Candidatus Latescibacterota bacterium]
LDAATGEYLFSIDAGIKNVVASIDPLTGVKTIRPEARPRAGSNYLTFPNHYGARSWAPTAYDPAHQRLYLPLTEGAQIVDDDGWQTRFPPGGRDGSLSRIQAVEIGQELEWRLTSAQRHPDHGRRPGLRGRSESHTARS